MRNRTERHLRNLQQIHWTNTHAPQNRNDQKPQTPPPMRLTAKTERCWEMPQKRRHGIANMKREEKCAHLKLTLSGCVCVCVCLLWSHTHKSRTHQLRNMRTRRTREHTAHVIKLRRESSGRCWPLDVHHRPDNIKNRSADAHTRMHTHATRVCLFGAGNTGNVILGIIFEML